jgi:hypothetical protein
VVRSRRPILSLSKGRHHGRVIHRERSTRRRSRERILEKEFLSAKGKGHLLPKKPDVVEIRLQTTFSITHLGWPGISLRFEHAFHSMQRTFSPLFYGWYDHSLYSKEAIYFEDAQSRDGHWSSGFGLRVGHEAPRC